MYVQCEVCLRCIWCAATVQHTCKLQTTSSTPDNAPPPTPTRSFPPPPHTPQVHSASGALLRERTQLQASAGYVDDMLAQAQSVSRTLLEQRRVFDSVQVR